MSIVTSEPQINAGSSIPLSGGEEWAPYPHIFDSQMLHIPPGLERLYTTDTIVAKKQVRLLEVFTGWECKNQFKFSNQDNQMLFNAGEESSILMRQCCGRNRGFIIHMLDEQGKEVLRVTRKFRCCVGCCWCATPFGHCAFEVVVEHPPSGAILGYVRQQKTCWYAHYAIMNSERQIIYQVRGPCCVCVCCCECAREAVFNIFTGDNMNENVGHIARVWSGACKEIFTEAGTFYVTLDRKIDVKMKAVLIGAMYLINYMFFEKDDRNDS